MTWKVVRTFGDKTEAEIAKSLLESQGIAVRLATDDLGGLQPQLDLTRGVQLCVHEEDFAQVKELLDSFDKKDSV